MKILKDLGNEEYCSFVQLLLSNFIKATILQYMLKKTISKRYFENPNCPNDGGWLWRHPPTVYTPPVIMDLAHRTTPHRTGRRDRTGSPFCQEPGSTLILQSLPGK
jgi:hypothetical protein